MQHFLYRIKILLRTKSALFWAILFPLFLGVVFYFMFSGISELEQFSTVPVGVYIEEDNEEFLDMLDSVEIEENKKMFKVTEYSTKKAADEALKAEKIEGYIVVSDDLTLVAMDSEIQTSIIKAFLDQYKQNVALIEDIMKNHPEQIQTLADNLLSGEAIGIEEIDLKGQDKDLYTQYFYAVIAMMCLIASTVGLENGMAIQANLSAIAARRNVAPTKKMKQVMTDFFATLFIYCIMATLVLAVFVFIFKRDFGNDLFLIMIGTWIGVFVGLAVGTLISVLGKGSKTTKDSLCVTFFMVSSFLGGLQWGDITYYIEEKCPIINRINPATLIVNAFKSLSVFGDFEQYMINIVTLLAIGVLFLVISILKLRRTKYASL